MICSPTNFQWYTEIKDFVFAHISILLGFISWLSSKKTGILGTTNSEEIKIRQIIAVIHSVV